MSKESGKDCECLFPSSSAGWKPAWELEESSLMRESGNRVVVRAAGEGEVGRVLEWEGPSALALR